MSFRFIVLLVLTTALTVGCSKSPTAKKSDSEAPTSIGTSLSKMNIDDVLARTDYSDSARKKFENWKKMGRKEIYQREISDVIRLSMIREPVTMEITSRLGYRESRQPSLSSLNDPPPSNYPKKPTNALQLLEGKVDYARLGIEHFKKRDIFQLQDNDRQAIAEYMTAVLEGPDAEFNRDIWDELGKKGADLAKRLAPQLKDEPMFNLCLGLNESHIDKRVEATKRVDHAIEQFARTEYPTRMPVYGIRLINKFRSRHKSETDYAQRIAATKHWISKDFRARGIEERFALDDVRLFLKLARMNRDTPALDEFVDYVESSETLPKWFQSMALAEHYSNLAFYYRGTGYANTVTKEGWEKFEENSKIAHKYFEEALKINPNYPEAAAGLMDISKRGHSDKSEDYWFKKAIEHEVDYIPVYYSRLHSLMPRWGGSVEEMIEFATEHANKKQYETGVPFILPDCIFFLREQGVLELDEYAKLTMEPKILDDLITALEGLNEHNTQNIFGGRLQDEKFVPTLLALYLTRAGRGHEAEQVYRTLDGQHSPFAVKLYGAGAAGSLDALSASAVAASSEYGIEAEQLQALMVDSVEQRIANLGKIEELVGTISLSDPSGGLYFSRALKRVQLEKRFADGEVVNIDFDPQMNMWKMTDNRQLTHVSETTATFDNRSGDRHNTMVYGATFPGPRVTELTFTFPKDGIPDPTFAPGFVAAQFKDWDYNFGVSIDGSENSQLLERVPTPDEVCRGQILIGANNGSTPGRIPFPYRSNKIKLSVYTDKNWFEVYANDQYVFSYRNSAFEDLFSAFALQMTRGVGGTGTVEVSDIKIQKWSGGPPETRISNKLVKHYQDNFDRDPDDKWNQFWLAHALHNNGDQDAALKLYEQSVKSGVSKQMAGFYIGDILDRQGKRKEAFDWYMESAAALSEGGPTKLMYAHHPNRAVSEPINWSSFRALWLHRTCGFEIEEATRVRISGWDKLPKEVDWLEKCMAYLPKKDDHPSSFDHKVQSLAKTIKRTPQRYKQIATQIREAIETDGLYKVSPDDEPVYLQIKETTPFFRSIDKMR